MKILLIAIPRSGSTTLTKTISSTLNLSKLIEPFNEALYDTVKYDIKSENDVIVKSLIDIVVPNRTTMDFYKEYSKLFDKTILLSRHNVKELSESYAFQMWENSKNLTNWHQKYNYIEKGDIDEWISPMIKNKSDLENLSNELNIEIDWYEDLYSGNEEKIVEFLNKHEIIVDIPKFCAPLNPIHKLRQFKKTII